MAGRIIRYCKTEREIRALSMQIERFACYLVGIEHRFCVCCLSAFSSHCERQRAVDYSGRTRKRCTTNTSYHTHARVRSLLTQIVCSRFSRSTARRRRDEEKIGEYAYLHVLVLLCTIQCMRHDQRSQNQGKPYNIVLLSVFFFYYLCSMQTHRLVYFARTVFFTRARTQNCVIACRKTAFRNK